MYYYYLPEPPYFLILFGLFAGITSGLAFEAVLKERAKLWRQTRSPGALADIQGRQLIIPFLGICFGCCVFLASSLEIFSVARWLAYVVSAPITGAIAGLIWAQLGKLLLQIEAGGSRAIDLDSL